MSQLEDIFASTFTALRSSLKALQEGQDSTDLQQLERQLQHRVTEGLQVHCNNRLQQFRHQHKLVCERYESLLDLHSKAAEEVQASRQHFEQLGQQHQSLALFRLQQQQSVSDRRLQDLIFEVVGEYGKALVRAKRREDYLLTSGRAEKVLQTWAYLWRRFILRLQYDLSHQKVDILQRNSKLVLSYLNPTTDSIELLHLIKRMNKKIGLVSESKFHVTAVVRVSKGTTRTIPQTAEPSGNTKGANPATKVTKFISAFSNQNIRIAETKRDLVALLEELNSWVGVKQPTANPNAAGNSSPRPNSARARSATTSAGVPRQGLADSNMNRLLSSAPFSWLHVSASSPTLWDQITEFTFREALKQQDSFESKLLNFARVFQMQYQASLFNDRVYFCLEERSIAQSKGILKHSQVSTNGVSFFDLLTTLQEIYADYPQTHSMLISPTLRAALNKKNDTDVSTVLLVEMQRMFLTHPLRVIAFQNKHQHIEKHKHIVSQRHNKALLETVSHFPDILVVQSLVDDTIFHFAPASVLNLLETSEGVANNGFGIPTLFCPILSPNIPTSSILSNQVDNAECSLTSTIMQRRDHKSMSGESMKGGTNVKNTNFEPIYAFPLSQTCIDLLNKNFLGAPEMGVADGWDRWSSLQILPDQSRKLGCGGSSSQNLQTPRHRDQQQLSHTYALLADENPFGLQQPIDAAGNKIVQASYYLIQLALVKSENFETDPIPLHQSADTLNASTNDYDDDFEKSGMDLSVVTKPISNAHPGDENHLLHYCVAEELRKQVKAESIIVYSDTPKPSGINQQTTFFTQDRDEQGKTPRTPRRAPNDGEDEEKSESQSSPSSSSKKSWDITVLSRVCHWRSCLCDVTGQGNLCQYHLEMKHFLDTRMSKGGTLESSKYLPKKPPAFSNQNMTEYKRDLMTIRAASTLLQELWDGRLKSTVKLFSKKMSSDMKLRGYLEGQINVFLKYHGNSILKRKVRQGVGHQNKVPQIALNEIASSLLPMPPTWSLWKNRDHLDKYVPPQSI